MALALHLPDELPMLSRAWLGGWESTTCLLFRKGGEGVSHGRVQRAAPLLPLEKGPGWRVMPGSAHCDQCGERD